jgi:tRNA nucleotidyltransferase (CCA-adding enzyme)
MTNWDSRALAVVQQLRRSGHQAVLVGGCVRDSLLSIPPHDYDVTTSALPWEILSCCAGFPCLNTGLKHGTVTVLSGGLSVEVTTFRREGSYSDHRHPDQVEFTSDLTDDLARRDFTINAMAWGPEGLIDRFGGQEDLNARLIRCVGDPDRRMEEDALRLLRGLRLAGQLRFTIHPDTAAAIHGHAPQLSMVAWERISAEFLRLLCSPGAEQVLLDFPDVVTQILPELGPAVGFDQRNPHHRWDVYTHSVKTAALVPPSPALRLAALLHDVGKPASFFLDERGIGHFYGHDRLGVPLAERAMARLRLDNATRERAAILISRHHLPVEPTRRWAGRWLSRLGEECFFQLLKAEESAPLERAEALGRQLLEENACLSLRTLAVNGHDALKSGLAGPQIGQALHELLDYVAQGELPNERSALLSALERYLSP